MILPGVPPRLLDQLLFEVPERAAERDVVDVRVDQTADAGVEHATAHAEMTAQLFVACVRRWGSRLLHVCDRGYPSSTWVGRFVEAQVDFVLRWRTDYKLADAKGERTSGQMSKGKRSLEYRLLWDARHRCEHEVGTLCFPVKHPKYPDALLWLVVGRPQNGDAWHFLTNTPVESLDQA